MPPMCNTDTHHTSALHIYMCTTDTHQIHTGQLLHVNCRREVVKAALHIILCHQLAVYRVFEDQLNCRHSLVQKLRAKENLLH